MVSKKINFLFQAPLWIFAWTLGICLMLQASLLNARSNTAVNVLIEQGIKIERSNRGIQADLMNMGDFYYRPDGRKISLLRKKDVYIISGDLNKRSRAMKRFKQYYGERVKEVRNYPLAGADVIRLDNSQKAKLRGQRNFDIQPYMLQSLDHSIETLEPVFANSKGQGDLRLLNKVTVKFVTGADSQKQLQRLKSRYGLTVDRKLRLSGDVYSLNIETAMRPSNKFSLVRSLMNDQQIEWAEPQFYAKPYKTSFDPSGNPLYEKQWHLKNTGFRGSRCDADCDANNAWDVDTDNVGGGDGGVGAVAGEGMVVAILDDGVDLNHEDLKIWVNPNETAGNSIDDDGNGCVDDVHGCDFVNDPNNSLQNAALDGAGTCVGNTDGTTGPDGDPSPQAVTDCFTIEGDRVGQDDHGTAVAGLVAAIGDDVSNTDVGVVGTAFRATILPVRIISSFDAPAPTSFCTRVAEAIEYAGRYADVINNSWGTDDRCVALETALANVSAGTVMDNAVNVSKRKSTDTGSGSPIVFASGNNASGWVKVTVPVSAGEHAYEWRYYRTGNPDPFDEFNIDQTVWLDDISFPDGSFEGFEDFSSITSSFTNNHTFNKCDESCNSGNESAINWIENTDLARVRSGTASAKVDMSGALCTYTYLYTLKSNPNSGEITFWVWVSTYTQDADKFEFLIDGKKKLSYSDIASAGFVNNEVGYPANLSASINGVISVGASTSGDLSGTSTAGLAFEERISYSQFGAALDIVAPSSDQHLGIVTTDRTGTAGYNVDRDIGGTAAADPNYTDDFGGTSAAAPLVAGVAAAIIAIDGDLDASQVRQVLRDSADKIGRHGPTAYDINGHHKEYGYGRLNMLRALQSAAGKPLTNPAASCSAMPFDYVPANDIILPTYSPISSSDMCAVEGPIPQSDDLCIPIKASNDRIVVICI